MAAGRETHYGRGRGRQPEVLHLDDRLSVDAQVVSSGHALPHIEQQSVVARLRNVDFGPELIAPAHLTLSTFGRGDIHHLLSTFLIALAERHDIRGRIEIRHTIVVPQHTIPFAREQHRYRGLGVDLGESARQSPDIGISILELAQTVLELIFSGTERHRGLIGENARHRLLPQFMTSGTEHHLAILVFHTDAIAILLHTQIGVFNLFVAHIRPVGQVGVVGRISINDADGIGCHIFHGEMARLLTRIDHHHKSTPWFQNQLAWYGSRRRYRPGIAILEEQGTLAADERQRQRNGALLIASVDSSDIPSVASSPGHDHPLARIAVNKPRLVPHRRQMAQEILHLLGLGEETLGSVGQMLQATLKKHGECQFMGMGGDVRMLGVAERTWGIIHRTNHVACEWECGVMTSRLLRKSRHVVIPFRTIDALCGKQVGPCALPPSRNGRAMEVDQQVMSGGTLEQVEAVVHVALIVAREEVDLHASHAQTLTPSELLLTVLWFVEPELGTRGAIYPSYRRVIPDERLHAL